MTLRYGRDSGVLRLAYVDSPDTPPAEPLTKRQAEAAVR
jgi:hypothetical protein